MKKIVRLAALMIFASLPFAYSETLNVQCEVAKVNTDYACLHFGLAGCIRAMQREAEICES